MRRLVLVAVATTGCRPGFGPRGHGTTSRCSSSYPQGIGSGTFKVYLGLSLEPQDSMRYRSPASLTEALVDAFALTVQEDAANNPGGPQFAFVDHGSEDVWLGVAVKSSGSDPDMSDQAWVELDVSGLGQRGWLFSGEGSAITAHDTGEESPEYAAVVGAANRFYDNFAYGWTCVPGS